MGSSNLGTGQRKEVRKKKISKKSAQKPTSLTIVPTQRNEKSLKVQRWRGGAT